jgi:RNA polymerase sigma-70 factor (ECF subfamily)
VNDDDQLIDEALAGSSAAFGSLVTKYQDRLYNTMVHVVGSAEDAQDIVQEAFVQAFVHLRSFLKQSTFYTWLYRIAFNSAVSRKRRERPLQSMDDTNRNRHGGPADSSPGPADCALGNEVVAQVRSAIGSLSEEFRTVVVLKDLDGCSYEMIAEVLGLPIGTVRSRLHRGRMRLREQLSHLLVEES